MTAMHHLQHPDRSSLHHASRSHGVGGPVAMTSLVQSGEPTPVREGYQQLLRPASGQETQVQTLACATVRRALQHTHTLPHGLPDRPDQLPQWMLQHHQQVHQQFQAYRQGRQLGGGRRYFGSRAQALLFLHRVAPTKLVDGAWLQGLTAHWRDSRLHGLIQIYLDELGRGQPLQNHVVLYRHLLQQHEIPMTQGLEPAYFEQGLLQLALGQSGLEFLPEMAGFNLGYEQLPLHLLITAHELNELGIDPYYFNLHVTVDNAASGHARQALDCLEALWPQLDRHPQCWSRVQQGHGLRHWGTGSLDVIAGLDLEAAVLQMMQQKAVYGQLSHSDRCRIQGKTINAWLVDDASTAEFLQVMQQTGWIRRHENPDHSRFWGLMSGAQPLMQGVFNGFELQLLHDWIAGDWLGSDEAPRVLPYHRQASMQGHLPTGSQSQDLRASPGPSSWVAPVLDHDPEAMALQTGLASCSDRADQLDWLSPWLAVPHHAEPSGLWATREFAHRLALQPR